MWRMWGGVQPRARKEDSTATTSAAAQAQPAKRHQPTAAPPLQPPLQGRTVLHQSLPYWHGKVRALRKSLTVLRTRVPGIAVHEAFVALVDRCVRMPEAARTHTALQHSVLVVWP